MAKSSRWTAKERDTLVKMWKEEASPAEISQRIKKSTECIGSFVYRHQKKLGIVPRTRSWYAKFPDYFSPVLSTKAFEKAWSGPVPRGHWTLTKPWRKSA